MDIHSVATSLDLTRDTGGGTIMADGAAPSGAPEHTGVRHLNQSDLAARWRMSERTLERRRYLRQGPPYVKIGSHVLYRQCDIDAYEAQNRHSAAVVHPHGVIVSWASELTDQDSGEAEHGL